MFIVSVPSQSVSSLEKISPPPEKVSLFPREDQSLPKKVSLFPREDQSLPKGQSSPQRSVPPPEKVSLSPREGQSLLQRRSVPPPEKDIYNNNVCEGAIAIYNMAS